jgi:WhiB family transcriptional regulator, redox-sensing transcriptional regulator
MTDFAIDWRAAGACRSADPDLFFPIATHVAVAASQMRKAQLICAGCGVRQQCLDFAVQNGEMNGVWGGTTPEERIRARRALMRRRRAHRAWEREVAEIRAS